MLTVVSFERAKGTIAADTQRDIFTQPTANHPNSNTTQVMEKRVRTTCPIAGTIPHLSERLHRFSDPETFRWHLLVWMKRNQKLDVESVRRIRDDWNTTPQRKSERLARKYGVSVSTIEAVLKRKTWKYVN